MARGDESPDLECEEIENGDAPLMNKYTLYNYYDTIHIGLDAI